MTDPWTIEGRSRPPILMQRRIYLMKIRHGLGLLLLSAPLILAGCGGGQQKAAEEQDYPIKGKVLAVHPDKPAVKLDHEDIPGLMKGMEMEFPVDDAKMLEGLQVGDEVEGQLKMKNGKPTIIRLQKKQQ
jgi:Cu/Ag efflux protein CusF